MTEMAGSEWKDFLLERPRTAKLATVRRDSRPHVAPVWIDLDDGTIVFTTSRGSAKGRAIRRDPRVALCVDEETPPFAFVIVEGLASVSEDLEEMLVWATRIAGRYMGIDAAEAYGRRNAVPGELLVRVTPERVIAQKDLTL